MESSKVLKKGKAQKVIFFYPGEEGSFISEVDVILLANGITHLRNLNEDITTHISNIEIIWHDTQNRTDSIAKVHYIHPSHWADQNKSTQVIPKPRGLDRPPEK